MDDLIREAAEKHTTSAKLLFKLLEWERARVHLGTRMNLKKELKGILESHVGESSP